MSTTIIRRAESLADYHACQEAQRQAWGIEGEGYVVPVATLIGAQRHGGLVLGAFLEDGRAVALSFAFLGRIEGRIGLYSQLTGVVPSHQGQRLGERLKHAQRAIAREEGLPLIAWAFDPLQAGNAHFNLTRLGATVGRYLPNMYGARTDRLNAGAATDRVIAIWETDDRPRAEVPAAMPLVWSDEQERPQVENAPVEKTAPALSIEIPTDIAGLRASSPERAEAWRAAVQRGFERAFAAGHHAVRFRRDQAGTRPKGSYLLIPRR